MRYRFYAPTPVASRTKATPDTTPASTDVGSCTGGRRSAASRTGGQRSALSNGASASAGTKNAATLNPYADHGELHNSAIKYPVTVGHKVAFPSVIAVRDIAYVMNCVKTGIVEGKDIRAFIHTLRHVPNSDLVQTMKKELPYFLGSVCQRRRSNATVQFAHFAIFDLDHVSNIGHVRSTAGLRLPFIRYAFRSVRDGVKLIAQFKDAVTDESEYRRAWLYLAARIESELALPVDSTPDWARACFYSYDPDLHHNRNYCPFDVKMFQCPEWLETWIGMLAVSDIPGKRNVDREPVSFVIPGTRSVTRDPVFEIPNQTKTQTAQDDENGQDSKRLDPGSGHPNPPRQAAARLVEDPGGDPGVRDDKASDDFSRARSIVTQLAKMVIPYLDWIKCGHALYAGFGESGRELWHIFKSNPHYHDTERELDQHWRSFARVHSVTLASLFYLGGIYGCK